MAITPGTDSILRAAEDWRDRAFLNEQSVFTHERLWTREHAAELKLAFVDRPDFGSGTFIEKLQAQLGSVSSEAKKLAAEMLWLLVLFPNNMNRDTKQSMVRTVWEWSGDPFPSTHPLFHEPLRQGIGSGGMGFHTYRWAELTLIILVVLDWRERPRAEQESLLVDPWSFAGWLDSIPGAQNRQFRHMLLHMLYPKSFERISSGGDKARIDAAFTPMLSGGGEKGNTLIARDRRLLQIRRLLEAEYPDGWLDFYRSPLLERWNEEVEEEPPPPDPPVSGPTEHSHPDPTPSYSEPPLEEITGSISKQGMRLDARTIARYHNSLKVRGFVILSGVSGTGKTWLTEAYAGAVEARHRLVAVAPNWTTNEDLLGYYNPVDGEYHDTPFSHFLREAAAEHAAATRDGRTPRPFHLVLDEMNLARVEYYFARFLSAMEVRARHGIAEIELGREEVLVLPPNLYFIGTVNVDETTHGFADKVYDRAQLIELHAPRESLAEAIGNVPHGPLLLSIRDEIGEVAPFAYRVVAEIGRYVEDASAANGWKAAFDEQVLQKLLPKLKGTDPRIGDALERLEDLLPEMDFPLSARKVAQMRDGFARHGFASYF